MKNLKGEIEVLIEKPTGHQHVKGTHHHHQHIGDPPQVSGGGLGERYYATPLFLGGEREHRVHKHNDTNVKGELDFEDKHNRPRTKGIF